MMKGEISITRFTSNVEPRNGINITLTDESSHCRMFEITLTIEQFGDAISGRGIVDCEYRLGAVEKAGMKSEHKTELIPIENPYGLSDAGVAELLKPYEVDGWIARDSDVKNHHNFSENKVRVSFVRYVVPAPTGQEQEG